MNKQRSLENREDGQTEKIDERTEDGFNRNLLVDIKTT
jgi:hypothetical protein